MVGEGVLHECLLSDAVESVLVINRRSCGVRHAKLKEIIHADFLDLNPVKAQLAGYDACFFCLGVSSLGISADEYFKLTHTLTLNFAQTVIVLNRDMVFCYVSGAGTDRSEKGRLRGARVKGKTEHDLMRMRFRSVYAFRPGFIKPTKGLRFTLPIYKYVTWLFPVARAIYPGGFCTLKEIGQAMIRVATAGYDKRVLEGRDIIAAGN